MGRLVAEDLTPEQQAFDATYKLTPMDIVSKYYEDQLAKDAVNHPDHYQGDKIECIEYLKDNMPFEAYLGYLEGNAKKYMHRWRRKGKPVEDLKKAIWYLHRLVTELDD